MSYVVALPIPPLLLLDTHALVWLMEGDALLGPESRKAILLASRENRVLVSAISPWEIGLLVSKKRQTLDRDVMNWVQSALAMPGVKLTPISAEIAVESTRPPWEMHADPADRILVATARNLGATLVTADRLLLRDSGLGWFSALSART